MYEVYTSQLMICSLEVVISDNGTERVPDTLSWPKVFTVRSRKMRINSARRQSCFDDDK